MTSRKEIQEALRKKNRDNVNNINKSLSEIEGINNRIKELEQAIAPSLTEIEYLRRKKEQIASEITRRWMI